MLFGDEDKENSTASWDYETETESTNIQYNATTTNEKGLLDAIKDSLSYVDGNKQSEVKQTNATNQTDLFVPNIPTYNVSVGDDGGNANDNDGIDDVDVDDDDDEDDEEEISILDFFLKGESAFTSSTTVKPFIFNITSKPLLNGMTNSPMQIQPILPDGMKNESMKFSMLPMSLYNMVKDDGSLVFENDKKPIEPQIKPSLPPNMSIAPSTIPSNTYSQNAFQEPQILLKNPPTSSPIIKISPTSATTTVRTTTYRTTQTTTIAPKRPVEASSAAPMKVKIKSNNTRTHASNHNANKNSTGPVNLKNVLTKQSAGNAQKIVETSTITIKPLPRVNLTIHSSLTPDNGTTPHVSTTSQTTMTPTTTTSAPTKPSTKKTTNAPKILTTTAKTTKAPTKSTTTSAPIETTTILMKPLTTHVPLKTTAQPKITAVQINSNPSILETDLNYDYGEPTLPPSLPNLRIIPFLPTDAVKKGEAQKNDAYKSNNYNYYHLSPNAYANAETHSSSSSSSSLPSYSPFNIKPPKIPAYNENVADDRIDYDTYKMPAGSLDSLDYISVYSGAGNLVQPQSFQMSVNSKLDYEPNHEHKVMPSKLPMMPSKNLTVKPPLPPFEPEHEYNLYNNNNHNNRPLPLPSPPSQPPTLHPGGYNEYSISANEPYASELNYNVPHFVTIPPIKEPLRPRPIHNKESVFSYAANKNKFIPPAKTEGNSTISCPFRIFLLFTQFV